VPRTCTSSQCQNGNPSAGWVALVEDQLGAPSGVVDLCGPCAAEWSFNLGTTVKTLPTVDPGNGLRYWPGIYQAGELDRPPLL